MKKRGLLTFVALLSIGMSVNIYTDLRGYHGELFDLGNTIFPVDLSQMDVKLSTDSLVLYNLPDGLWMLSMCLFFIMIWGNNSNLLLWLFLGLIMGFSLEVLRHLEILKGTFDLVDMLFYFIAFVFALIIHNTTKSDKWKIGKHTFYHS